MPALHAAGMPVQQLFSDGLYYTGHLHHLDAVPAAVTPCTPDMTRLILDTAAAKITKYKCGLGIHHKQKLHLLTLWLN